MSALHISISAETIAHIGPLAISNSILTSLAVTILIVTACAYLHSTARSKNPSKFQIIIEMVIMGLFNLCSEITGSKTKAHKFAPFIISFFVFIMLNNWAGLLPGVGTIGFREGETVALAPIALASAPKESPKEAAPAKGSSTTESKTPALEEAQSATSESNETKHETSKFVPFFRAATADLNTTLALAIISVVATQAFGIAALGMPYFSKYLNFSSPIMFFVGILEAILEVAKIISFAFRLFGNIFAGEVLLAVIAFLVPAIAPMPFYGLEIFVGFIQALVFSMLSLVFFNLATIGHADEHEH